MEGVTRIPPREAYEKTRNGRAWLVCAYAGDDRFAKNHLEGAIPYEDFKDRLPTMDKAQEVIFYCN